MIVSNTTGTAHLKTVSLFLSLVLVYWCILVAVSAVQVMQLYERFSSCVSRDVANNCLVCQKKLQDTVGGSVHDEEWQGFLQMRNLNCF